MWRVHRPEVSALLNMIAILCNKASENGTRIYLRWTPRKTFKTMYEGLRNAASGQGHNTISSNISQREDISP